MSERKNLGEVLHQYGRIRFQDQERALEYQRRHGGYFGEALVSLGFISSEELEFGLAAQFDLPYVFPDPESIDVEAARLVAPDWALAHLMLPIARTEEALRVVADSPIKPEAVAELEHRAGMVVDLAIASPARIRELILHVFDDAPEESEVRPLEVTDAGDLLDRAVASDASRFGVSVRGREVLGWWEGGDRLHRLRILTGWPGSVERRLQPSAHPDSPGPPARAWDARLRWGGTELPVLVHRITLPEGEEMVVELPRTDGDPSPYPPPPPQTRAEVRLLVRAGVGRFLVTSEPDELAYEILRDLPSLLLGPSSRSMHLSVGEAPAGSRHTLSLPEGPGERRDLLLGLRRFRLDGLTVQGERGGSAVAEMIGIAGALFVGASGSEAEPGSGARAALERAGLTWEIHVRTTGPSEDLSWRLRPLRVRRGDDAPPPPERPTTPDSPLPTPSSE